MWVVGRSLADEASTAGDAQRQDLFGRSALNRYYYAAFLEVRSLLRAVNSRWSVMGHADMPDLLTGKFFAVFANQLAAQVRGNQLAPGDASKTRRQVRQALQALADLLRQARETRRIADYEPEIRMELRGGQLRLRETSLAAAREWERRVQFLVGTVRREYRHAAIIS
jgi:hypothetical protein